MCGPLLVHFGSSCRSIPNLAPKQLLGRSSRLPYFGSYFHVSRCMSLPRQLESLLCSHLLVHFVLSYRFIPKLGSKKVLGRPSRLPYFGSDFHVCRCMSLPMQLESLLCSHLLVHFVTSYRFIPKLDPLKAKLSLGDGVGLGD